MRKSRFSQAEIYSTARPEKTRGFEPENAGEVSLSRCRDSRRSGDILRSALQPESRCSSEKPPKSK